MILGKEAFFSCWEFEEKNSAETPRAPSLPAAEGISALILKREYGKHHSIHYIQHLYYSTLLLCSYLLMTNTSEAQEIECEYGKSYYYFFL